MPLLMEDVNAGEMLLQQDCDVMNFALGNRIHDGQPGEKSILIIRPGGIGDLIFLNPILVALRKQLPDWRIAVACVPNNRDLFRFDPNVDEVVDYPVPLNRAAEFGKVVMLEGVVESSQAAREIHIVELFLMVISQLVALDVNPVVQLYLGDLPEAVRAKWPRTSRPRVGIQVAASQPCRTYPVDLMRAVIDSFRARGWEVMLFGFPGTIQGDSPEHLINLTQCDPPISILESFATLLTCDVVVGQDSAITHAAGALSVPCVALYGAFPAQLRVAYHPSIVPLQGQCPISPCFHHQRGMVWPAQGPCRTSNHCEALASISPALVVETALKIAKATPAGSLPAPPLSPQGDMPGMQLNCERDPAENQEQAEPAPMPDRQGPGKILETVSPGP